VPVLDASNELQRWFTSGAADLTGPSERPGMAPPEGFVAALDRLGDRLARASATLGPPLRIDPLAEVTLRGRTAGLSRLGRTSCGGAARLLRCDDGWVALNLPRPTDLDLVPALVEATSGGDVWSTVTTWCSGRSGADVVERAVLLGLAAATLAHVPDRARGAEHSIEVPTTERSSARWSERRGGSDRLRVVELASLWAGPLCGRLLALAGCDVVKVESTRRPDGARGGSPTVYASLNAGKRSVALDLSDADERRRLAGLIDAADVVIEGSRARALDQWHLGPHHMTSTPVWVSITGHGRSGDSANRIGFGDDAAVSAGLVTTGADGPWFCADAVADPLTGMVAATLVAEALAARRAVHLDMSLAGVASWFAARTCSAQGEWRAIQHVTKPPRAHVDEAAALGRHTAEVLREWAI